MSWRRISILLCSRFIMSVLCMLLLLRTLRSPMTKLFALVARKFLFCAVSFSFCGLTGIHFHRIRLLVIFMCNERCSFSRCQFVSSKFNCTEFLSEQIHLLCANRNGIPDILEIVIFFTKCGQNSSSQHMFRQCIFTVLHQFVVYIDSLCSLVTCVLISSLQSHYAWKNDSVSILSRCVHLHSNCARSLSQMSLALVQVNTSSATDLLRAHAMMLAALASSCHN